MRRVLMISAACAALVLPACSVAAEETAAPPATEEEKTLYSLGAALARNISAFNFTEAELARIQAGFADAVLNRELEIKLEEFGPKIDPYLQGRIAKLTDVEKAAGATFREEKGKVAGAQTTATGVIYRELVPGTGASPAADDTVKINYRGTLRDGSQFDSSYDKPEPGPVSFNLKGVIPCFSEGLQKVKVGGKSELVCPPEAAYGDRGSAPLIKPGATLVFEVELVEIEKKDAPAPVPTAPAAPDVPKDLDDAPTP